MPSATLSDEDFINKSLLASLDAQADAEPLDDSDNDDHHRFRPDSPSDNHFPQQHYPHKNLNYRASFTSYPNTTRSRLNNANSASFRDSSSFYTPSDPFSPQITSPHISSYDPRNSYDYNASANGAHKPFLVDQFSSASLHKPHNHQHQQPLSGYPPQNQYSSNSIQLSSQTPYGPHLPSVGSNSGQPIAPGLSSSVSMSMVNGTNNASSGEEISTIFVVGFPEDMQEREFQNMFTFSQGFEAATLKIPNKEYTAYGSIIGGPPGGTLPNLRGAAGFQYAGPNDPYNIVTVNQGGVVVDGGRDGTMASWPAAAPTDDLSNNLFLGGGPGGSAGSMGLAGAGSTTLSVPRKQIIGFAKFRSREEALTARDILQGRRVDIEKGAVLKAEMAKKNLHTKRGVGPVPGAGVGLGILSQQQQHVNGMDTYNNESFSNVGMMAGGQASNRDSLPMLARLGGRDSIVNLHQQAQLQSISQSEYLNGNANSAVDADDRLNRAGGVTGLNMSGLSLLSTSGTGPLSNSSMSPNVAAATIPASQSGLSSQQRGPRERAEEEEQWRRRGRETEREREAQEKEANLMRLRANNAAAFDAFHGLSSSLGSTTSLSSLSGVNGNGNGTGTVGPSLMSRQNSTASTTSLSSGSGAAVLPASSPMLGGAGDEVRYFHPQHHQSQDSSATDLSAHLKEEEEEEETNASLEEHESQHQQDEIVGPWDRVSKAIATSINHTIKPTESERSTSPPADDLSPQSQQAQPQGGYQYQPQYMHLHEQQQQLQFQSNLYQQKQVPQQYRGSSQSDTSETGSAVGGEPSSSGNASSPNPIGYVGARLGFVTGNQNQGSGQPVQSPGAQSQQTPLFTAQTLFARGLSGYMNSSAGAGVSNNSESGASASSVNTNPSIGANVNTSAGGSGSTSASGSGGNTSPTLPSPASGSGSGSTTSATSAGTNGNGTSSSVRGTVDQNPPINTLYVGNLPTSPPPIGYPSDYLEETLREIFSVRPGYRKLCFRHKANGPMCFVEFEDVQHAARALQEMSGNTLRGVVKNGIRLSYSKNPLGVRTPTSAGSNTGGPTLQQQQQLMQTLSNHQQFSSGNNHHQSNGAQDPYQLRSSEDFGHPMSRVPLPASIMRRDSSLSSTGPNQATSYLNHNNNNASGNGSGGSNGSAYSSFFSSPPPRFYATSPTSNMSFGATTSTPLTSSSNAFVPRSAAGVATAANGGVVFNNFGFGGVSQTSFSPFSVPFSSSSSVGEGSFGTQPSQIPHLQPLAIPGGDSHSASHHQQDE